MLYMASLCRGTRLLDKAFVRVLVLAVKTPSKAIGTSGMESRLNRGAIPLD